MWKFILYSLLACAVLAEEVTTQLPDVDVTTTEKLTTTTEKLTTTETPSTTAAPTTTLPPTTVSPQPAPAPVPHEYYNVSSSKGVYCLMVDGDFSFLMTYDIGNSTNQTTVTVPKPSVNATAMGSCDQPGMQWMNITWGTTEPKNSIKFNFNQTVNSTKWSLASVESLIAIDSTFLNATQNGSHVYSLFTHVMSPIDVAFNQSYRCYTELVDKNSTSYLDGANYTLPVQFEMRTAQLQAFNTVPTKGTFVHALHCDADKIADVVPIAVGCALAALVLIVIIAYIVGRRRRSASYESV